MKTILPLLLLLASAGATFAAEDAAQKPADETIFHEPFTLKLHVDKEHFYEERFGRIPFVHNGDVYLFKGDEFGLALEIQDNSIRTIQYQPDVKKADVTLKFTQELQPDGTAMMLLHIHNNTQQTLNVDALMTVPDRKGIAKTSILPIGPGLSGFESWPHPIVQLVLRNIRVGK
ncbi:MAG: hypothetical protein ABJF10_12045 [Chthoniobacter sp.]|uniref:hypothetical protein n=1 Tax=Chthoniobacter sp. TaxID=2510640 RepID=UPI0032A96EFE